MKITIITLTKGGLELALKVRNFLPEAELFTMPHFSSFEGGVTSIDGSLKDLVKDKFNFYDILIFIMSTGIVVRTIAPLLQHKSQDPAVIVMDEAGRNVISLLSGHLGGANEWTLKLSSFLKANPVITTASDVRGILSVDLLAQQNNCVITDWEKTKIITAHLVNGGNVGIYSELAIKGASEPYHRVGQQEELRAYPYGIIISHFQQLPNSSINGLEDSNLLQIYPKNLVLGIGCRKDTPYEVILEEICYIFKELSLSTHSIAKIATVDIKAKEKGLLMVANHFKVPIEIIPREAILEVEKAFESSEFVRKTIGVGAVSGPCSFLASGRGKLILEKHRNKGITISIAEMVEV
ncbi:cobalt-precorrin 5A hydrolase [Alkaliphilus transvaalensis]|uniref:cobalt-precorrin 5A hydrolase n=1 Tax=Alkaliphilus transvaalensis TaxID=114628 RepID=UPI0004786D1E|nr:cobalt-precorrin 5A hydrolase [Alkaliphilus transvaalensis]